MKLEVKRREDGMVELHLEDQDGKITVYLCQDSQAAIFKLAQLLFQAGDNPKETQRSILVGEFTKKEEAEPDFAKAKEDLLEKLKKAGLSPLVPPVPQNPFAINVPVIGKNPYLGYTTLSDSGGCPVWFMNNQAFTLSESPIKNIAISAADNSNCYYVSVTNADWAQ